MIIILVLYDFLGLTKNFKVMIGEFQDLHETMLT